MPELSPLRENLSNWVEQEESTKPRLGVMYMVEEACRLLKTPLDSRHMFSVALRFCDPASNPQTEVPPLPNENKSLSDYIRKKRLVRWIIEFLGYVP